MNISTRLTLAASLALVASPSFAASDGTLGSTSTGTTDITLTKGDGVQISGVTDVAFGATTVAPGPQNMDACIFSTTGGYSVEVQSLNTDGTELRMTDGAGTPSFINYDVEWDDTAAAATGVALTESVAVTGFTNAFTADPTCGGGVSGRLIVSVQGGGAGGFNAAPGGAYTDTLTMIIAPN